jgi:hypothetical protein
MYFAGNPTTRISFERADKIHPISRISFSVQTVSNVTSTALSRTLSGDASKFNENFVDLFNRNIQIYQDRTCSPPVVDEEFISCERMSSIIHVSAVTVQILGGEALDPIARYRTLCKEGYTGPECLVCEGSKNYVLKHDGFGGVCQRCNPDDDTRAIIVVVIVSLALVALATTLWFAGFVRERDRRQRRMLLRHALRKGNGRDISGADVVNNVLKDTSQCEQWDYLPRLRELAVKIREGEHQDHTVTSEVEPVSNGRRMSKMWRSEEKKNSKDAIKSGNNLNEALAAHSRLSRYNRKARDYIVKSKIFISLAQCLVRMGTVFRIDLPFNVRAFFAQLAIFSLDFLSFISPRCMANHLDFVDMDVNYFVQLHIYCWFPISICLVLAAFSLFPRPRGPSYIWQRVLWYHKNHRDLCRDTWHHRRSLLELQSPWDPARLARTHAQMAASEAKIAAKKAELTAADAIAGATKRSISIDPNLLDTEHLVVRSSARYTTEEVQDAIQQKSEQSQREKKHLSSNYSAKKTLVVSAFKSGSYCCLKWLVMALYVLCCVPYYMCWFCLIPTNQNDTVVGLVVSFLFGCFSRLYHCCSGSQHHEQGRGRKEAKEQANNGQKGHTDEDMPLLDKYMSWLAILFITFAVYPSNTARILEYFDCYTYEDGERFMVSDADIHCRGSVACSPEHGGKIAGSRACQQYVDQESSIYLLIAIYPFGIPLFYFLLLYGNKKRILEEHDTASVSWVKGAAVGAEKIAQGADKFETIASAAKAAQTVRGTTDHIRTVCDFCDAMCEKQMQVITKERQDSGVATETSSMGTGTDHRHELMRNPYDHGDEIKLVVSFREKELPLWKKMIAFVFLGFPLPPLLVGAGSACVSGVAESCFSGGSWGGAIMVLIGALLGASGILWAYAKYLTHRDLQEQQRMRRKASNDLTMRPQQYWVKPKDTIRDVKRRIVSQSHTFRQKKNQILQSMHAKASSKEKEQHIHEARDDLLVRCELYRELPSKQREKLSDFYTVEEQQLQPGKNMECYITALVVGLEMTVPVQPNRRPVQPNEADGNAVAARLSAKKKKFDIWMTDTANRLVRWETGKSIRFMAQHLTPIFHLVKYGGSSSCRQP